MPTETDPAGPSSAEFEAALGAYGLRPSGAPEPVEHSVRNQNYRVPTEGEGPPPDPAGPGVQPVHGDYHERNVLLDDSDTISAVVDWDMVTRMPRGFEIVRCLTYAGMLDRPRREAYLTAYRQHTRLAPEECPAAVDLWWRANLRESWLYRTRLIENDRSVQQFFPEHLELLTRFADPSFRAELAGDLRRLAGADR